MHATRGVYELGGECQQIKIEDILRATRLEDAEAPALGSLLVDRVVLPAVAGDD
jgi:hypothetical protein